MHLANRITLLKSCTAICLGLTIVTLPLAAIAVKFEPPNRGLPGRREGAGTRGPACVQGSPSLTTLLPQTNVGLTTADYPQFFWFVPKTKAKAMKFMLFQGSEQEPEQELVYEATLETTGNPGVTSLTLPKNATPPLSVGKDYYWAVTLLCNPDDPISNMQVSGWVQRVVVEPTLANQLSNAKPGDRVNLYAQNGYWFDTVSALANLRCANPKDPALVSSWAELMKSVKLDKVAEQPIGGKCGK